MIYNLNLKVGTGNVTELLFKLYCTINKKIILYTGIINK